VVLGVALARWLPWGLVPIVAVVLVGMASVRLSSLGDPAWTQGRMLSTAPLASNIDPIFVSWPVWEHVAWLLGLVLVVAGVALLRHVRSRLGPTLLGAGVAVALLAAALVLRPTSANEVDRIAALVTDPLGSSTCVPVADEVRVCAFEEYGKVARMTAEHLRPVAAAVPDGALDDVIFMTWYHQSRDHLQAQVLDSIGERSTRYPTGALRLRFSVHPENFIAARLRLANVAVGLPAEAFGGTTSVAGQARGVVALWLATRGLSDEAARDVAEEGGGHQDGAPTSATERGQAWPGLCHDEEGVLVWAPSDLAAARTLIDLPEDRVARFVHDGWDRFTDPATTTDDLLVAAGLDPLGAPAPVGSGGYAC
jgi:hypothetical protein